MTNEFEEAVVSGWPEVGEGLRMLRSSGPLHASLSGSGAASFAVFDDPDGRTSGGRQAARRTGSCTWERPCRAESARLEVEDGE